MSDFMSLGRRIRHYRMLRGMTQKALGIAAGFPPETADIRIAQYESGARTPKYALLCTLAEALCVPPSVLDIPRIKSREALKKLLLALEDEYGLTVTITEATKGAFAMRQFVFSVLAILVAVGLHFLLKPHFGTETVSWMCILGAAPFAALGFITYHGMTAEQFLWAWLRSELLEPKELCFEASNLYYEALKDKLEGGKS